MLEKIKAFASNFIDTIHWRENRWTPQVRAAVQPYTSCFGHSMAWFLNNLGIKITPDEVMREVNSEKWYREAQRIEGVRIAAQYRNKINQLWNVMVVYANSKLATGKLVARAHFETKLSDEKIRHALRSGPVICAIRPRYKGRILGHVVLIVGNSGENWVVDDPYGDFTVGYPTHMSGGDDIIVGKKAFRKIVAGMFIVTERTIW